MLLFAAALFQQGSASDQGDPPQGSSRRDDESGLSAIFTVLQDEGLAIRWERPLERLSPNVGLLVVWQPVVELTESEWRTLIGWVRKGHRLVISAHNSYVPGRTMQLSASAAGSAAVHGYSVGVGRMAVGPEAFQSLDAPVLVHVARKDGSPVLVSRSEGEGRIFWSADHDWIKNGLIASDDNLTMALHLLSPATGKLTAFDEYHHGFQAPERWWEVLSGPLFALTIQGAVALALFFWAAGFRFGTPQHPAAATPRAAVEYVQSMGNVYNRAGARRTVQEQLGRYLRRSLRRALGGAPGIGDAAIARLVADRTGLRVERVEGLLRRTDPDRTRAPAESGLIATAREVHQLLRSVRHARHRDHRPPGVDPH